MDNITVNRLGQVLIQEDPGGNDYLSGVFQFDPTTGVANRVARHDADRFTPGAPGYLTRERRARGSSPCRSSARASTSWTSRRTTPPVMPRRSKAASWASCRSRRANPFADDRRRHAWPPTPRSGATPCADTEPLRTSRTSPGHQVGDRPPALRNRQRAAQRRAQSDLQATTETPAASPLRDSPSWPPASVRRVTGAGLVEAYASLEASSTASPLRSCPVSSMRRRAGPEPAGTEHGAPPTQGPNLEQRWLVIDVTWQGASRGVESIERLRIRRSGVRRHSARPGLSQSVKAPTCGNAVAARPSSVMRHRATGLKDRNGTHGSASDAPVDICGSHRRLGADRRARGDGINAAIPPARRVVVARMLHESSMRRPLAASLQVRGPVPTVGVTGFEPASVKELRDGTAGHLGRSSISTTPSTSSVLFSSRAPLPPIFEEGRQLPRLGPERRAGSAEQPLVFECRGGS